MLRLPDATGRVAEVGPARALRLRVVAAPDGSPAVLRAAVTADVLRRLAGLRGVRTEVRLDAAPPGGPAALAALNVPPPDAGPADPPSPRPPDVAVLAGGAAGDAAAEAAGGARHRLLVGPVVDGPGGVPGDGDPLALRLVLLGGRYAEPVAAGPGALAAAAGRLRRWRAVVARAAESPSAAMAAGHVERFLAALDDDLDTPAALAVAAGLAEGGAAGVPPGAVFETLANLDRVLALDLARDVGRPA